MTRAVAWLGAIGDSLVARVAVVLATGMAVAAIGALMIAEQARIRDLEHVRLQGVVDSTADIAGRLARNPIRSAELLHTRKIFGAREAARPVEFKPDADLTEMLAARLGPSSDAQAMPVQRQACLADINLSTKAAGMPESALPDCWFVQFRDASGVERHLTVDGAPFKIPPSSTLDPVYLLMIVGASGLLSIIVSRLVTAPLRRLTSAARAFSVSIDPEPIPEHGPREIRVALATFNIMQHRVRGGFRERTQLLAAIAHDLQTPLTRLRLRLEDVENEKLRERLLHDLAATHQMVRDGLDLARSSETREPWSIVDIDSILSSVAEDAAEFGADVRFVGGCGVQARIRPGALARCLNNLVDNAVKYAGDAELDCKIEDRELVIHVRDHGPGIPDHAIEEAFEPYRRLNVGRMAAAPGGTGLGLTIAKAQAQTSGASLTIHNHPDGGLIATIRIDLALTGPAAPKPRRERRRVLPSSPFSKDAKVQNEKA